MTRRRLATIALAGIAAAGTFGASAATADAGVSSLGDKEYIACAGLRTVNVATCIEEPTKPLFDLLLP